MNDTEEQQIFIPGIEFSKNVLEEIDRINEIITDGKALESHWNDVMLQKENRILSLLMSSTLFEYKLRKHLKYLNRIGDFRVKTLLNLFRCETHRLSVIDILERKLSD
jgi:hypothetical protein